MPKLKTGFLLFHLRLRDADREKKDKRSPRCIYKKQKLRNLDSRFDLLHANKAEEKRQTFFAPPPPHWKHPQESRK